MFNKILKPFKYLYKLISYKIKKSLRLELIFTFGLCFLMAIVTFIITNSYLTRISEYSEVDYNSGINEIYNYSLAISEEINGQNLKIENTKVNSRNNKFYLGGR